MTAPFTSATIEALRKAAEAKLRAGSPSSTFSDAEWEAVSAPDPVEAAPKAPKPKPAWPDVLAVLKGASYSSLFGEAMIPKGAQDFRVPTFHDYPYPEWMKAHVPKDSDYMAEPELVYKAVLAYARGSVTHIVGHPGTGKSEGLPKLIAAKLGMPLFRFALNKKGMLFEDLIGREAIVHKDGHTITEHKDGLLVKTIQHPTLNLLDEFCRSNMEIQSGCMSLMERNGKLIVENRSEPVVPRNEHAWVVASDNVKGLGDASDRMVGTELVDGAILDRFDITIEVDYLPEAKLIQLIEQWVPGIPDAKKLAQFAGLVQDAYKKGKLPLSLSPRGVRAIAEYACVYRDYRTAVRDVFFCKLAEDSDKACVNECFRTVFSTNLT